MYVFWIGFLIIVFLLLALDLGVFNKKDHVIKTKEALLWTLFWISLSLLFNVFIYYAYQNHWLGIGVHKTSVETGSEAALRYFTGYIVEKSLSLDNIFVIALIFSYFKVPAILQHRVLFWGILGALILRGTMILAGITLIEKFNWMIYVFGGLLLITAFRMLFTDNEEIEPEKNVLIKLARKLFPISQGFEGHKFFTKVNGKKAITPLFLVLLVIESTDVLFAIDSIPAIFAVTTDSYIVFTSNIFAILGLRSLYFALAAMMNQFKYLRISLVFILAFVGVKMLLSHAYPIPTLVSLGVIASILIVGTLASIISKKTSSKQKNLK